MTQIPLPERHDRAALAVEAAIVLAVFGLMALIGPFGTFGELSGLERVQYWGFIVIVNWLQLRLIQLALVQLFTWDRFWVVNLGASFLGAVPATFEVLWLESRFRPHVMDEIGFLSLYPQVLVLCAAVMVPVSWYFIRRRRDEDAIDAAASATEGQASGEAFFRRVPVALGRDLYALQAEDHYIRVHTATGSDLILHRMSDAIAELDGLDGLQVHRSWWVARAGLADVVRRDRKVFLKLKNGVEAPVSRTFMSGVRDAGWLA
ncbi:MAG: LytTR family DNA-binding domain-containing protein [Minwuia sp.]|uniref:LytTR family DNA-binding domain-containing protein n=1 Tax=Minwuia sp. TaxID=2493630 RepID=UPI003A870BDA